MLHQFQQYQSRSYKRTKLYNLRHQTAYKNPMGFFYFGRRAIRGRFNLSRVFSVLNYPLRNAMFIFPFLFFCSHARLYQPYTCFMRPDHTNGRWNIALSAYLNENIANFLHSYSRSIYLVKRHHCTVVTENLIIFDSFTCICES